MGICSKLTDKEIDKFKNTYNMKKATSIIVVIAVVMITACNGKSSDPQSSPRAVAEAIFDAAKTGNYQGLAALIDTDADNDSRRIAQAATDEATQEEFKKYFAKGKVNGEPVVNDDKASVNILFGLDGTNEETFEMVKKDGKWYLQSF